MNVANRVFGLLIRVFGGLVPDRTSQDRTIIYDASLKTPSQPNKPDQKRSQTRPTTRLEVELLEPR